MQYVASDIPVVAMSVSMGFTALVGCLQRTTLTEEDLEPLDTTNRGGGVSFRGQMYHWEL